LEGDRKAAAGTRICALPRAHGGGAKLVRMVVAASVGRICRGTGERLYTDVSQGTCEVLPLLRHAQPEVPDGPGA
jgi:hypothetical protein